MRPSALRTSSEMPCLPRLAVFQNTAWPSCTGARLRSVSPPPGSSSLTTSAPRSPHRVAEKGAASTVAMSRMRTPSSG